MKLLPKPTCRHSSGLEALSFSRSACSRKLSTSRDWEASQDLTLEFLVSPMRGALKSPCLSPFQTRGIL